MTAYTSTPGGAAIEPVEPPAVATTPTTDVRHSRMPRGLEGLPSSSIEDGRFGRMFRRLPVFSPDPASLRALAERMVQDAEPDKPLGADDDDQNLSIPAGYTYLGQFVDHDITFDPVSSLQRQNDPNALHDFRTPRFDLDSLYGRGPSDQPYLYNHATDPIPHPDDPFLDLRGAKLLLGALVDPEGTPTAGPDLPRNGPQDDPNSRALIGDPRNDENIIVSQLHATFMKFHNRVVDLVAIATRMGGDDLFKEAQRLVRWHYQWVVVRDFLPRMVGADVVDDILRERTYVAGGQTRTVLRPELMFYHWREKPFMPVEFSVAAYRFGHSMIRPSYFFNDFVRSQTEPNRTPIFSASTNPLANLNGFRPLPRKWGIQWKYFFDLGDGEAGLPQPSYKIDAELVFPLGDLPPAIARDPASLAERNLLRGKALGLPSGESVARAMGIEPFTPDELEITADALGEAAAADLAGNTPLWYYVLKEAELHAEGSQLEPLGGRIVAEVLVGLLAADPLSFLSVDPTWRPTLGPAPTNGGGPTFTMADLIRVAAGP